ncbi:MAG: hypothetical protein ABIJ14_03790 [Nanoarchaeota archaeon]
MIRGLEICIIFLVIISLTNVGCLLFLKSLPITGSGITATVSLNIFSSDRFINIWSPSNTTYNFSIGDPYTLNLNVSATNFIADGWWYTLWDLKHNEIVNESIGFTPNTTFEAVRWSNKIAVYADNEGETINANVTFYVDVPNSSPILTGVNSSIYVCENSYLNYPFNVTDVDEQNLEIAISPTNPFYIDPLSTSGAVTTRIELFSGVLDKDDAGGVNNGWKIHKEIISASDGEYADSVGTNITVIEINNAPVISNIGVQTVWTKGGDSTFYKQVEVEDIESGNQSFGNLTFNITFLEGDSLFNITNKGVMNFTPTPDQIGVYNLAVCVNDTGINNPHENISAECGQDGSPLTTCNNFSLTITDENRAPTIIDYYPNNLNLDVSGTSSLYFNISKYDPDATIPDTYWYVNDVLKEYDSGSLVDEFTYNFGCGVSGIKTIKSEITDGLLNDSLTWTLDVSLVECPIPPATTGRGGGGGASITVCEEKWACDTWKVCQNAKKSLEVGLLSGEDYRIIKERCTEDELDEKSCGVHIRTCFDFKLCATTYSKPSEVQSCHYTEDPNCHDEIKNCHDEACELLVDCGGPCSSCPTCSDKIRNQGEEKVDCGGPCPWKCPEEIPLLKRSGIIYTLLILILILILITIRRIVKIVKYRQKIKNIDKTKTFK